MELIHEFGYITKASEGFFKKEVVGTIKHSYFLELEAAIHLINKHLYNANLFKLFEQNAQEFATYIGSIIDIQLAQYDANLLPEMEFTCNRLYINMLSSFRSYLDHTEKFLKNIYGNESIEYFKFRDLTNEIHLANFEYQFIYELRNYTQHCALPINGLGFKISADKEFKPFRCELILEFAPKILLDNYKKWGKLKGKIESFAQNIVSITNGDRSQNMQVLPITQKFLNCMYSIRDGFQSFTNENIIEPVKLLYEFINASQIKDFDVIIFSNIDGHNIKDGFSGLPISECLKSFTIKIEEIKKLES